MDKQKIAKALNYDEPKGTEMLGEARNQLRDELLNWIRENLALSLDSEAEKEKINTVLEEGLQTIARFNQGG